MWQLCLSWIIHVRISKFNSECNRFALSFGPCMMAKGLKIESGCNLKNLWSFLSMDGGRIDSFDKKKHSRICQTLIVRFAVIHCSIEIFWNHRGYMYVNITWNENICCALKSLKLFETDTCFSHFLAKLF